ncbi:hypothetical protein FNAPI_4898 [Fusarium napiforme]|uniref:Uncharacterized protein n=1 Tax=Fusarium napiforme TaxID=42672 RepID=A0A8H5JS03_9HYPO|nr:hypothetical protein FNAPI_4898 [Fusarium napiforme]
MSSQAVVKAEDFDFSADEPTVVGPNESDIATTQHGEQMNVEAPGRRRFGNCHLWSTSDGPKNASYNVEDDGPQKGLCPRLPIESEHATRSQVLFLPPKRTGTISSRQHARRRYLARTSINYRLWKETDDFRYLNSIVDSFTQFNADRLYSPQYSDEGEAAFFHDKIEEPLSDETMSSLVTEFKIKPDDDDINAKIRAIFTSTQVHANYMT